MFLMCFKSRESNYSTLMGKVGNQVQGLVLSTAICELWWFDFINCSPLQQKMVIRVYMAGARNRKRALGTAAELQGSPRTLTPRGREDLSCFSFYFKIMVALFGRMMEDLSSLLGNLGGYTSQDSNLEPKLIFVGLEAYLQAMDELLLHMFSTITFSIFQVSLSYNINILCTPRPSLTYCFLVMKIFFFFFFSFHGSPFCVRVVHLANPVLVR